MSYCTTCGENRPGESDREKKLAFDKAEKDAKEKNIPVAIWKTPEGYEYGNAFEAYRAGHPVIHVFS